jgi:hypothetical protein
MFMAPLKERVIICGTWVNSISPGTLVPSAEQKQSGRIHWAASHRGAAFGSSSTLQAVSSDPSLQSVNSHKNLYFELFHYALITRAILTHTIMIKRYCNTKDIAIQKIFFCPNIGAAFQNKRILVPEKYLKYFLIHTQQKRYWRKFVFFFFLS